MTKFTPAIPLTGVLLALGLSPSAASTQSTPTATHLTLREQESRSWLADVEFNVLDAADNGELLVGTTERDVFYLMTPASVHRINLDKPTSVLAGAFVSSRVEIFDGQRGALLQADRTGRILKSSMYPELAGATAAVRSTHGWFIGAPQDSGGFSIVRIADGMSSTVFHYSASQRLKLTFHLTAIDDCLLLTNFFPPFNSIVVKPDSGLGRSFEPLAALRGLSVDDAAERWVSLAPTVVGDAILQVIADLRSDQRAVVLLDKDTGRIRGCRIINAPIGFPVAAPARQVLVAVRNSGQEHREIVWYSWTWNTQTSSQRSSTC